MANETLTGCVNLVTGEVIFDQDDCEYFGCMVWTGTHAGQVSVTIGSDTCDDTYFGCVDITTGQFQVVIPDDCCSFGGSCPSCSVTPPSCFALTLSGQSVCLGCKESAFAANQSDEFGTLDLATGSPFELTQTSDCVWGIQTLDVEPSIWTHYGNALVTNTTCEDKPPQGPSAAGLAASLNVAFGFPGGQSRVTLTVGTLDALCPLCTSDLPEWHFSSFVMLNGDPCEFLRQSQVFSNNNVCGDHFNDSFATGGTATIRPIPCT